MTLITKCHPLDLDNNYQWAKATDADNDSYQNNHVIMKSITVSSAICNGATCDHGHHLRHGRQSVGGGKSGGRNNSTL